MRLTELLLKDAMDLNLTVATRDEAIQHLAERFHQVGGVSDVAAYVEALMAREAQSTTGVGDHIAIPHAQHESITQPAIIFARSKEGIDWSSFDGKPVHYIFMIAAPTGGGGEHLQALAKLSQVLMNKEVQEALETVSTPQEVLDVFSKFEQPEEPQDETVAQEVATHSTERPYIVAVTACPTGIAHTFMAEEKLKQTAVALGYDIKVETNGQSGIGNRLTKQDIDRAVGVVVAADKQVEMARFDGKPVLITKVADGINKPQELLERAATGSLPIYHGQQNTDAEFESSEKETFGRQFYKHLMNGVSHMLPFVVAGGILIALSFFWGINAADPTSPEYNPIAQTLNLLGGLSFAMMLPVLSGYIGHSLADRPGLVIGMMGGVFANPSILSAFGGGQGLFENSVSSGFLGALIAGFLAGGIVWFLKKAFSWLPKALEGMKPIFLYPLFGVLLMGLLMLFVINGPMGAVMNGIMNFLNSIPQEYSLLLGFLVAAMMAIDMGGPINKAAYVTGTALVTASGSAGSNVMAAVMIGGMVPPLAIALSATFNKHLWPEAQRNSALVNYVMGAAFITEGAIPFAAINPLRVIPSVAIGAGVAGALSMFFGSVSKVPHGGIFAVLAGGVSNPLMYLVAWLIGGIVGAVLLNVLLKEK